MNQTDKLLRAFIKASGFEIEEVEVDIDEIKEISKSLAAEKIKKLNDNLGPESLGCRMHKEAVANIKEDSFKELYEKIGGINYKLTKRLS